MSKPAPLSRTKKANWGSATVPNWMQARGLQRVNFQALRSRLSRATRRRRSSPWAQRLGAMSNSAGRSGSALRRSAAMDSARALRLTGCQPHFASAHPRELEQVLDQVVHLLAGVADAPKQPLAVRIELGGVAFKEDLAETEDAAQGRAQVVRDGIGEGLQLFVDRFQLGGALRHRRSNSALSRRTSCAPSIRSIAPPQGSAMACDWHSVRFRFDFTNCFRQRQVVNLP